MNPTPSEWQNGQLIFEGTGAQRKRIITFTTKKGKIYKNPINPAYLSADLKSDEADAIEVELQTDTNGKPVRVARLGAAALEAEAAALRASEKPPVVPSARASNTTKQPGTPMNREFHNPYNFIPTPPRPSNSGTPLDDAEPMGHDKYHANRWSGRISVTLTTHTPLLIPATQNMRENKATQHKTFPTRLDGQGRPYLPSTSIKGMLRAAYEAITNSRLAVFESHDAPLAYRKAAQKNAMGRPVRIEVQKDKLRVVFMKSLSLRAYDDSNSKDRGASVIATQRRYFQNRLPIHEQEIWVECHGNYADNWLPLT